MPAHMTHHRVRFHELDPYDHVNHAMYVTYFEIGRVEALDELGIGLDVLKAQGFQFVVTRVDVRFKAAATAGDDLTISTGVGKFARATTMWHQEIRRGDERIATAEVTVGVTNREGKAIRPEPFIFEKLQAISLEDPTQSP